MTAIPHPAAPLTAATDDAPEPLLTVRNLAKAFDLPVPGRLWQTRRLWALHDLSLDIRRGETLGLVGESGSGKTTAGRAILRLDTPTRGSVSFAGQDLAALSAAALRRHRRHMQMIFQSPIASLNPRMTVRRNIDEALRIHDPALSQAERADRVVALLDRVGLSSGHADRHPHSLSGGQCQRIGIARALAVRPQFIVADEPVSALDVSIQAQVLNLMLDVSEEFGLTMLFVSHDLGVVRHVCDRIVVLYLGRVMEIAPTEDLFAAPAHPYTRALIAAAPRPRPGAARKTPLRGEIPSPLDPPSGCVFRTRCPMAGPECASVVPELRPVGNGRMAACLKLSETPAL